MQRHLLDAIAEAGRGQLHHSGDPEEIVDVVMGELGEMTKVAAHSAKLRLHFPEETKVQQLTRFRSDDGGHFIELGDGSKLSYDRLVVAPGVSFDKVPGLDVNLIPHAWKAGSQTLQLQQQIK